MRPTNRQIKIPVKFSGYTVCLSTSAYIDLCTSKKIGPADYRGIQALLCTELMCSLGSKLHRIIENYSL